MSIEREVGFNQEALFAVIDQDAGEVIDKFFDNLIHAELNYFAPRRSTLFPGSEITEGQKVRQAIRDHVGFWFYVYDTKKIKEGDRRLSPEGKIGLFRSILNGQGKEEELSTRIPIWKEAGFETKADWVFWILKKEVLGYEPDPERQRWLDRRRARKHMEEARSGRIESFRLYIARHPNRRFRKFGQELEARGLLSA